MIDAIKLAGALRRQACPSFPSGCRKCGARGHCDSRLRHLAAAGLEELLHVHQLDLAEITRLRRMIEAREEVRHA